MARTEISYIFLLQFIESAWKNAGGVYSKDYMNSFIFSQVLDLVMYCEWLELSSAVQISSRKHRNSHIKLIWFLLTQDNN